MGSPLLNPEFARSWRQYLWQCGLATVALIAAIGLADLISGQPLTHVVVVASIGSTAFVLFITPHSSYAAPRYAVGGHAIAVAVSVPFAIAAESIFGGGFAEGVTFWLVSSTAAAVGAAMLVMSAFRAQHPPAAGTVLAVFAEGVDFTLVSFLAVAVLALSAVHLALRRWLIDLF